MNFTLNLMSGACKTAKDIAKLIASGFCMNYYCGRECCWDV